MLAILDITTQMISMLITYYFAKHEVLERGSWDGNVTAILADWWMFGPSSMLPNNKLNDISCYVISP